MTGAAESWAADVARALGFKDGKTTVLRELAYKSNDDWFTFVSAEMIHLRTGMSEETIRKKIKEIETDPQIQGLLVRAKGAKCRGGCLFPDGSSKNCTPGHSMPDGFYLNMVIGEVIIDEAIERGVKLPSQRHWKNSRVAKLYREKYGKEAPDEPVDNFEGEGETQPVKLTGWPSGGEKPQVRTNRLNRPVRYTQPVKNAVQPVKSTGLARDREPARRASFKNQLKTHSSSAQVGTEEISDEWSFGELAAGAASEEEPLRGATSVGESHGGSPGPSAGDHRSQEQAAGGEDRYGVVDVSRIAAMLSAVGASTVDRETAHAYSALVLSRASESHISNPTAFVAAAIRNSPGRTREDLGALGEKSAASGLEASRKDSKPTLCPIPGHQALGLIQVSCPECRGITGEHHFPVAITGVVFDRLLPWQQDNLRIAGVEVSDDVDEDSMRELHTMRPHRKSTGDGRTEAA